MRFLYLVRKAQNLSNEERAEKKSEKYGTKFKLTLEHLPYSDWLKAEANYLFLLKVKIHVKSSSWTKIYQRREGRVVGFRSPCPCWVKVSIRKQIFKNIKITQVLAEGLKINSRLREVNILAGMASLIMELHLCKIHCRATTRSINSLLKEWKHRSNLPNVFSKSSNSIVLDADSFGSIYLT